MRFTNFLFVVATFVLVGCTQPPQYEYKVLGTTGIRSHQTPYGGGLRRLCQFRVEIGEYTLGYAGSSTTLPQHNKCLTMKNGDQITVTKRTRISGQDQQHDVQYAGKVGEIEFPLN